jgi:hypothetical protein
LVVEHKCAGERVFKHFLGHLSVRCQHSAQKALPLLV